MVTNGISLGADTAKKLIDLGLDKLIVSMDGAGPNGDDTFHGDSITRVQANLRGLQCMKLVREAALPEVGLELVATRDNLHELPALRRLCPELGVSSILVTNLIPYTAELTDRTLYRDWTTTRRDPDPTPWNPTIELPRMDADPQKQPRDRPTARRGPKRPSRRRGDFRWDDVLSVHSRGASGRDARGKR